jgi:hypothetical protein
VTDSGQWPFDYPRHGEHAQGKRVVSGQQAKATAKPNSRFLVVPVEKNRDSLGMTIQFIPANSSGG